MDFSPKSKESKESLKTSLSDIFDKKGKGTLIVYSGAAMPNGDWLLENANRHEPEFFDYEEMKSLWQARKSSQKNLLMIIDSNYSGQWTRRLSVRNDPTISIQSSTRYWQKAAIDAKLGSYFLHNLYKITKRRRKELIVEPMSLKNLQHKPSFYGSFERIDRHFGLKLKYDIWHDMR